MMNVSRSKDMTQRAYSMKSVDGTSTTSDLGITIDHNLTFEKHIGEKVT